ncbi:hypothetical protein GBAR_LOCUS12725 [Geodia barretti]|uniref:Uncharacterized protein n=1 Tax=Geodia barretti TaxID=519541 RepID=A0AA35S3I4_GEOBA|nr:hypothetical protein GBAR_LOCUS12725 [Geodia barretti]
MSHTFTRMARPPFQPNQKYQYQYEQYSIGISSTVKLPESSAPPIGSPYNDEQSVGDESTNESSEDDIYVTTRGDTNSISEQLFAPTVTVTNTPPDMPSDTIKAVDTEIAKEKVTVMIALTLHTQQSICVKYMLIIRGSSKEKPVHNPQHLQQHH